MKKYQVTIRDSSGDPILQKEVEANSPKEAYKIFVTENKPIPFSRVFINWGLFGAEGFDPPHYEGHVKDTSVKEKSDDKPSETNESKNEDLKIANTAPATLPSLLSHRDRLRDSTAYPVLRIINLLNSAAIIILAFIWGGQVSSEAAFIFGLVGIVVAILSYSLTSVFFDVADSNINTSRNSESKD